jgi:23S rRNA (guanine745-N1)-methyltransferase
MIVAVLADVAPYLRCPVCAAGLTLRERVLGCEGGHRFDVARQGYVSLLPGDARTGTADTAAMVAARAQFLATGEYAPLTGAVADAVAEAVGEGAGLVLDAGGGTGHHLAAILDRCPAAVGLSCDLSRYAARRAARAHPRTAAVVADVWRGLPVRDGTVYAVADVFAPRNAAEFRRVLRPDGLLLVVTPQPDHLGEAVRRLDLLSVDEEKPRRLDEALSDHFTPAGSRPLRWTMQLGRPALRALVAMGPSAWHAGDLDDRLSGLAGQPEPLEVTAAVTVSTYRPLP